MPKHNRTKLQQRIRRLEVRLQRNPTVQSVLRGAVAGYLRLIQKTARCETHGFEQYAQGPNASPILICGWHGNLAGTPLMSAALGRSFKALASDHADGMLIVDALRRIGHDSILLPTSGDKTQALRTAVLELRSGTSLAIATDGPMGPAEQSKPGAVVMAALSGAPLVAIGMAARPALRLGTWDRFVLPLPFCRIALSAGPAIAVPRKLTEDATTDIQAKLDAAITNEVEHCRAMLGS